MAGNRYFTWDGYYRGPGSGIGFVLTLGLIIYGVTHPGTVDHFLEQVRPQLPDHLPAPTVTPPAPPGDVPTP